MPGASSTRRMAALTLFRRSARCRRIGHQCAVLPVLRSRSSARAGFIADAFARRRCGRAADAGLATVARVQGGTRCRCADWQTVVNSADFDGAGSSGAPRMLLKMLVSSTMERPGGDEVQVWHYPEGLKGYLAELCNGDEPVARSFGECFIGADHGTICARRRRAMGAGLVRRRYPLRARQGELYQ